MSLLEDMGGRALKVQLSTLDFWGNREVRYDWSFSISSGTLALVITFLREWACLHPYQSHGCCAASCKLIKAPTNGGTYLSKDPPIEPPHRQPRASNTRCLTPPPQPPPTGLVHALQDRNVSVTDLVPPLSNVAPATRALLAEQPLIPLDVEGDRQVTAVWS
jgi:hypothetical protein